MGFSIHAAGNGMCYAYPDDPNNCLVPLWKDLQQKEAEASNRALIPVVPVSKPTTLSVPSLTDAQKDDIRFKLIEARLTKLEIKAKIK